MLWPFRKRRRPGWAMRVGSGRGGRLHRHGVWLGLLLLAVGHPLASNAAVQPDIQPGMPRGLQELRHTGFRPEDGAPNTSAALAQTADGFLWIGTPAGLYRYDGARFDAELSKRLPSPSIRTLFSEADGSLWIGYTFGGVSLWRNGQLQHLDRDTLPPGGVKQFFRAADGVLWVSTSSGLARLSGERWQTMDGAVDYSGETPDWMGVIAGRFGVITRTSSFVYDTSLGHFERRPRSEGEVARYGVPPGSTWRPDLQHTIEHEPNQTLLDRDGSLWVSGFRTLVRYRWSERGGGAVPREDDFTTAQGLTGDVSCILQDREWNIWVGTDKGLDRFSVPTLQRLYFPDGAFNTLPIAGDLGDLWVASTNHPIRRLGQHNRSIPELGNSVMAAFRAADGTLWTAGQGGLFQYAHDIVVLQAPPPVSVAETPEIADETPSYQAIAVDAGGTLWLSIARI